MVPDIVKLVSDVSDKNKPLDIYIALLESFVSIFIDMLEHELY